MPLWKNTVALLRRALEEIARSRDDAVFPCRDGDRMSRSGVEHRLHVGPGEILWRAHEHAMEVVRLDDPAKLQVRVDVPVADASRVGAGLKARVTADALPGRSFEGVVTRVVPQADVQKNTVQVRACLVAPDAALRPEMLARVEFSVQVLGADGRPVAADVALSGVKPLATVTVKGRVGPRPDPKVLVIDATEVFVAK